MDFSSINNLIFASTIKKAIDLNSKKNWFNLERAEKIFKLETLTFRRSRFGNMWYLAD